MTTKILVIIFLIICSILSISAFILLLSNKNKDYLKKNIKLEDLLQKFYKNALKYASENQIEGNVYTQHHNSNTLDNLKKINNIGKLIKNVNNFLEVGFNAGHSCLTALYNNPKLKNILIFDINHHKYTEPNYNLLKNLELAKNVNLKFVKGDSTKTIPKYNTDIKYDFIHIDGGHSYEVAKADIINCKKFASKKHILLIDDCNTETLKKCLGNAVNDCIQENIIRIKQIPLKFSNVDHIVAEYIF
jgi:predicted O-methyltransferase YrrM